MTIEYDYLNSNNNRNIYNTNTLSYNCGGYALNTFNWYYPRNTLDDEEMIDSDEIWCYREEKLEIILVNNNYNIINILNSYALRDSYFMIQEFSGRLRRINAIDELKNDERAIAYRLGHDSCDEELDFHFMFKNYNDTKWSHKMGSFRPENNKFTDNYVLNNYWEFGDYCYDSNIILMALKLKT